MIHCLCHIDSQPAAKPATKKAKKIRVQTEPFVLTFRPLDGAVNASLQRADKVLEGDLSPFQPDKMLSPAEPSHADGNFVKGSLEILWSLQQLQSNYFRANKVGEAAPFDIELSSIGMHTTSILSELIDGFTGLFAGRSSCNDIAVTFLGANKKKEAFASMATICLAILDICARLLDSLPEQDYQTEEVSDVRRKVSFKVLGFFNEIWGKQADRCYV